LYVSEFLTAKCVKGKSVWWGGPAVGLYICGIAGVVCMSRNNGREIFSPPVQELAMEKVAKYGIGKQSVGLGWKEVRRWRAQETTIRNWIFHEPANPTIHERDSDKWRSMESRRTASKMG
jgi:hypothetical protein